MDIKLLTKPEAWMGWDAPRDTVYAGSAIIPILVPCLEPGQDSQAPSIKSIDVHLKLNPEPGVAPIIIVLGSTMIITSMRSECDDLAIYHDVSTQHIPGKRNISFSGAMDIFEFRYDVKTDTCSMAFCNANDVVAAIKRILEVYSNNLN